MVFVYYVFYFIFFICFTLWRPQLILAVNAYGELILWGHVAVKSLPPIKTFPCPFFSAEAVIILYSQKQDCIENI